MVESKVGVILPFHNAATTLNAAIESIVKQTFEDWELLLIGNNADTDSYNIAKDWHQEDSRIKLLHQPVQGIAHALNLGLENAKSEFIARMDADDFSHHERLSEQQNFLKQNPEIGLVACQCEFNSTSENAEGYRQFVEWQNNIITPEQHFINRFIESPIAHPSVMFRNDLVERFGNYSTENIPEDYELWLRWMNENVKFAKLEKKLLTWYDHEKRLSRTHENYSEAAFDKLKIKYLASWIIQNINPEKQIIVCGTGKFGRMRTELLQSHGIQIHAFTDVKQRGIADEHFIPIERLGSNKNIFVINFISKRGVRDDIRNLLTSKGFIEYQDFILAA